MKEFESFQSALNLHRTRKRQCLHLAGSDGNARERGFGVCSCSANATSTGSVQGRFLFAANTFADHPNGLLVLMSCGSCLRPEKKRQPRQHT